MSHVPYVPREVCELTERGLQCVPINQGADVLAAFGWVGIVALVAWVLWGGRK